MLLNKTNCKCGKDLRETRFNRYEPNFNKDFYGGQVDMYGYYKCDCGRELKGYFARNIDQSLRLIDLEVIKDIAEGKKIDSTQSSCVYTEETAPYIPKTYEEMSYKELKKVAKEKGIKGIMTRQEILERLQRLA